MAITNLQDLSQLIDSVIQDNDSLTSQTTEKFCEILQTGTNKRFKFGLAMFNNELKVGFAYFEEDQEPEWMDDVGAEFFTEAYVKQLLESEL